MELSKQQDLYAELERVMKEKCDGREFYLIFALEVGGKGEGSCLSASISSLAPDSPFGSWKGIVHSIGKLSSKLLDSFSDFSDLDKPLPIEPKI